MKSTLRHIIPVLPSADVERDVQWYADHVGFRTIWYDEMYAVLQKEELEIHLQWHANTQEDPLLGGSVIKIFVSDIHTAFTDFLKRGTITPEKLRLNTPWKTHEFGFFDLNKNAIFIVQDI